MAQWIKTTGTGALGREQMSTVVVLRVNDTIVLATDSRPSVDAAGKLVFRRITENFRTCARSIFGAERLFGIPGPASENSARKLAAMRSTRGISAPSLTGWTPSPNLQCRICYPVSLKSGTSIQSYMSRPLPELCHTTATSWPASTMMRR